MVVMVKDGLTHGSLLHLQASASQPQTPRHAESGAAAQAPDAATQLELDAAQEGTESAADAAAEAGVVAAAGGAEEVVAAVTAMAMPEVAIPGRSHASAALLQP